MDSISNIINYLLKVLIISTGQILLVPGILLILSLLMSFAARMNENLGCKIFGTKTYIYIFTFPGTVIHELGHAFFALLFGHKIESLKLFSPNMKTGNLGFVRHSYKKNNMYQNIGNFFIGIGPVIFGSIIILILFAVLYGTDNLHNFSLSSSLDFMSLKNASINLKLLANNSILFISQITSDSKWWKIIIFIYLLYSLGNSIALSVSDIKTTLKGLLYIFILFLIINLLSIWSGDYFNQVIIAAGTWLMPLHLIISINIGINLFFLIILSIIYLIKLAVNKD